MFLLSAEVSASQSSCWYRQARKMWRKRFLLLCRYLTRPLLLSYRRWANSRGTDWPTAHQNIPRPRPSSRFWPDILVNWLMEEMSWEKDRVARSYYLSSSFAPLPWRWRLIMSFFFLFFLWSDRLIIYRSRTFHDWIIQVNQPPDFIDLDFEKAWRAGFDTHS